MIKSLDIMFCVRFTSMTPEKGFKSALELETTTCKDVFHFESDSDRHDFEVIVATLCKVNRMSIAIVLDDIKVIAKTQEQIADFMTNLYDVMDMGANCASCRVWSFSLEASDGGLRFFIGDRSHEKAWIHDNLKLLRRAEVSTQ